MNTPEHPSTPAPRRGVKQFLHKRILAKAAVALAGLGACGALLLALAVALAWPSLPALHAMTDYRPSVPLRIYTTDHVLIGEFGEEHRNVRSEEHTSELQSIMRISYAVFCLKKKTKK